MRPATCEACGTPGPAKSVAQRRGWQKRGSFDRRRWYCPSCPPPAEPATKPVAEWVPLVARLPEEPPADPFARLRWERDRQALEDARPKDASPNVVGDALRKMAGKG